MHREEESLIDIFVFELLVMYVDSLALGHSDDKSLGRFFLVFVASRLLYCFLLLHFRLFSLIWIYYINKQIFVTETEAVLKTVGSIPALFGSYHSNLVMQSQVMCHKAVPRLIDPLC